MTSLERKPRGSYNIQKKRQKVIDVILQAAIHAFSINGYNGTSMQSIAEHAGVPKANIHYYFGNKAKIYGMVLEGILQRWDSTLNDITVEDDPADVLCRYIDEKIAFSRTHPEESRIFATEMLSGAPNLQTFLKSDYRTWFKGRLQVFDVWIAQGKIAEIDATHLLLLIWSATQHYADFAPQVEASMGISKLNDDVFLKASSSIKTIVLRACGLCEKNYT